MTNRTRILVVEDEAPLRMALSDALRAEDFDVIEAADGDEGLQLALREDPDVILLDLMLPKRDGFSVLRSLREDRLEAPVLILSARGEEWDRIQGFEFGADDYVVKPFSTRELLMRIRALLRRHEGGVPGMAVPAGKLRFGEVEIDFAAYSLTRAGEKHGLSRRELDLLRFFLEHDGEALDRLRILSEVWGADEFPTTRTIDTHVLKLRKKIEAQPENPIHLVTVHGVGYRFSKTGSA
ncbi:MAG: response regulator transcription factor [Planctomycetota bacterium]